MVKILDEFGRPITRDPRAIPNPLRERFARLTYDAVQESDEFRNYWAPSDALDADSSNSPGVRQKFRNRSRYEVGSNGYYAGILSAHVNMLVGAGPTLRMLTGNRRFNQAVESAWYRFAQRTMLRHKLWCMAHARVQDGEAFALLVNNPVLGKYKVQLDIQLIEAEQCASPQLSFGQAGYIDGIRYDQFNNILWYDILPTHPGAAAFRGMSIKPEPVEPDSVVHWFKQERPGSHRGIPALSATLNTGAAARRWREATLAAAETAADFTLFLKTQFPPEELDDLAPMSGFDIQKRMMTALPNSVEPFQLQAEQPTTTYDMFHKALVSESARPLSMPYNLAACDSSTYSYASGKLDTLCYRLGLDIEREDCNDQVLDKIFSKWFEEWTVLTGELFTPDHQWDWPQHPVIDAVSEANATDTELRNGTKTLRQAFTDAGMDFEDQLIVMAEDFFGEANDENIAKMRDILLKTLYPAAVEPPQQSAGGSPFGKAPASNGQPKAPPARTAGLVYCPTGPGGGVDPSCSPQGGGADDTANHQSSDNVAPANKLPDGFHEPINALARRDVKVKERGPETLSRNALVVVPQPQPTLDAEISEIANSVPGHVKGFREQVAAAVRNGTTVSEEIKNAILSHSGKGAWVQDLKDSLVDGRAKRMDDRLPKIQEVLRAAADRREQFISKADRMGFVFVNSQDKASDLIGAELTKRLGRPDESSLSPSKYWFTENGRSIRVSNHSPVYFFEDSGVNIVPNEFAFASSGKNSDLHIPVNSMIHPSRIADWAIDINSKLPPVDIKKAVDRIGHRAAQHSLLGIDARFAIAELTVSAKKNLICGSTIEAAFCPTGEGGGIDNSCSPHGGGGEKVEVLTPGRAKRLTIQKAAELLGERGYILKNPQTHHDGSDWKTTYDVTRLSDGKTIRVDPQVVQKFLQTDSTDLFDFIDKKKASAAFCPTGQGGGIDNSCSPAGAGAGAEKGTSRPKHLGEIFRTAAREGGFTYNPRTGEQPKKGWAVSVDKQREKVFDHNEPVTVTAILDYWKNNREFFGNEGNNFGGWLDTNTGKFYLDVSKVVPDKETALRLARENDQIGIFNLETKEYVDAT